MYFNLFVDVSLPTCYKNSFDFLLIWFLKAKVNLNCISLCVVDVRVCVLAEKYNGQVEPLCDFHLLSIEADLVQLTYDLNIEVRLGGLSLCQEYQSNKISLLNTPMAEGEKEYLFIVKLCMVSVDIFSFLRFSLRLIVFWGF